MKKYLLLISFAFLSFKMFSQLIPVPGQDIIHGFSESIKANDSLAFYKIYYSSIERVYALYGNQLTEISWSNAPTSFKVEYMGNLNDKYYFFDNYNYNNGMLYEYDHNSKSTRTISFPASYPCKYIHLLSDEFNNKIYYSCGMNTYGDTAILSFDGNVFDVFPIPTDYIIMSANSYFASEIDEILMWFSKKSGFDNKLYSFDGTNLTHIPNPQNSFITFKREIVFDDHVIIPYVEEVIDLDYIFYLYKYDGSNLVEITGTPSAIFHGIQVYEGVNKLYISFSNYATLNSTLYEYDGNSLNEILSSPYYEPRLLTNFNGKDIFSLYNPTSDRASLFVYDGNTFEEISGPPDTGIIWFGGQMNNKLYLSYVDVFTETAELYSYTIGDTQVQLVPNLPADVTFRAFAKKFNDYLIYRFEDVNGLTTLFAKDVNDQFWDLDPKNYYYTSIDFQLGNTMFFTYYNTNYPEFFMWDGLLNTPNYSQSLKDIVVFPNPVSENVIVDVPNELSLQNAEINIYSIDGKMVYQQAIKSNSSQLEIPLDELKSGIYILELKAEDRNIRTKIIKK